jgi:hypothetical protein
LVFGREGDLAVPHETRNTEHETLGVFEVARFIALDWDQNQLHVIEARTARGGVQILRAAAWEESASPNPAEPERLGQLLKERLQSVGIGPAPVLACLGRDRVILKDLRYPPVPPHEEPALVRFQAVKDLNDAPGDVVVDFTPVEGGSGGDRRALALILRQELLTAYHTLCQAAGLKLTALTPRPFGLSCCVRRVMGTTALTPLPEPPDGIIAVVALSERWGEFCIVRGDTVLMSRPLTIGPGLPGEIRRNLTVFAGQSSQSPVKALYLAGNLDPEQRQRLQDMLGDLPIHTYDPFAGSDAQGLPGGPRGGFAAAAGLLYAYVSPAGLAINFLQPRQPRAPRDPNKLRILAGVVALLLVLAAGGWYARGAYLDNEQQIKQFESDKTDLDARLTVVKEDGKRLKALSDWDSVVWLDELYDLTHRIPNVNALRVKQITLAHASRSATSQHVAQITIKGTLLDPRDPRKALDQLVAQFTRDGAYSPQAPIVKGNEFTLVVNVERRPPGSYKREIQGVS